MLRSPIPFDLQLNATNHLILHCSSPLHTPPHDRSGPPTRILPQLATVYRNDDSFKQPFIPNPFSSFPPVAASSFASKRPLKRVRVVDDSENNGEGSDNSGVAPLGSDLSTSKHRPYKKRMEIDMTMGMGVEDIDHGSQLQGKTYNVMGTENLDAVFDLNTRPTMLSSSPQSRAGNPSPPNLPASLQMKRPNLKKLSLSLPPSHSLPSSSINTPSTVCPTPTFSTHTESDSRFSTPYTPGPPKTPALAMSAGRSATQGLRRPSLLSLITQPPVGDDDVPPTPSASGHPYATMRYVRGRIRERSQTAAGDFSRAEPEKVDAKSVLPVSLNCPAIDEVDFNPTSDSSSGLLGVFGDALPSTSPISRSTASPTTSLSASTSASGSTSTTPSTSPPLPASFTFSLPMAFPARPVEPYEEGPIEFLPGIYIGAEESVHQYDSWAKGERRVRIVNVAQEIDDPFEQTKLCRTSGWASAGGDGKGKEKMKLVSYPGEQDGCPDVEYCHARWSHGELGLADLPDHARLEDVWEAKAPEQSDTWKFWDVIRWMEEGRRASMPVLIHCQCGVSRSATLAIAYTMALAASGAMPDLLGHMRTMQDAYDFVKSKSSWIGPNHSLVFQLVDFARNLTTLLQTYHSSPNSQQIQTSFPISLDAKLSEAEWARRRREFEESEDGTVSDSADSESGSDAECMSPEEADDEARKLDEAMVMRRAMK
ncbi:hypothetical protein IAR55_005701 [Kwoniella newhampshirensis]|uniref:protein-tyrosine-phosphatase n=1 Tax=Kwoniella newhampshirensis TaxID=1651941 RepID=A0AAW0YV88_9TREE